MGVTVRSVRGFCFTLRCFLVRSRGHLESKLLSAQYKSTRENTVAQVIYNGNGSDAGQVPSIPTPTPRVRRSTLPSTTARCHPISKTIPMAIPKTSSPAATGVKALFRLRGTQTADTEWAPTGAYLSHQDPSGNRYGR